MEVGKCLAGNGLNINRKSLKLLVPVSLHMHIDLSFVGKQTALVGMDGQMLAKHSILLTDVVTKFNIFANFLFKENIYRYWLVGFQQIQFYL